MDVNRPAAELAAEVVNAWNARTINRSWVDGLLARRTLPIRHRGPLDASGADSAVTALSALAQEAAPVFAAGELCIAAQRLNNVMMSVDVQLSVSITEGSAPHLHYDANSDEIGQQLRVNCLGALAAVLVDRAGMLRLGSCSSCGNAFVDFSRSARQRFCERRCATRSHVQKHRSKRAR